MSQAYIVAACRTAGGKKKGRLREWHPAELAAATIDEVVRRSAIPAEKVDDVILGCVSQVGAQAGNLARTAVLSSCLPISVPGTTVDRQCGSGQQALHFAVQAVMSGTQDVVIAGGVEVMTLVPIGSNIADGYKAGHGMPWNGNIIKQRYPGVQFSQFAGAEMVARKFDLSREQLDRFALASHQKAASATEQGLFRDEILVIDGLDDTGKTVAHDRDEGIRYNASYESLAGLEPLAGEKGIITAGTSSQICDGASAILVVNEKALNEYGLTPLARIVSLGLAGSDPVIMLTGPIPASEHALKRAGMAIGDIDLYEVNEAFAPVPLAWAKALNADPERLNVYGGAMALGHPLGSTGTKLMTTLVHSLRRQDKRYGLLAICEGGGTANATIIEAL